MEQHQKKPEISNVQYVKKQLADGTIELDINGLIDNEYYEATAVISQADFDNNETLNTLITDHLLKAKDKVTQLKKPDDP
ncbi:hypothetical protein [Olivibacter sp. XZL3]|uniref:hypothetical protein n=1 Tax=Olivibacter sp. XZL3 TaxID=1735116 RepID=UPI0010650F1B|nr:hypothetical protein [Olivibacter sp. XZL3]